MITFALLAVFLPLLGAMMGALLPPTWSQNITSFLMAGACVCAGILYATGASLNLTFFSWINVEFLEVNWGLQIDSLSRLMMAMVTTISFLVHVYAIGYMRGNAGIPRFMAYLSLFTFFMLVLVTAPNFLQFFFGWEGMGLCSYLLIGYWYKRDSATAASFKAFIMNRLGDVGFILGVIMLFTVFGTLDFSAITGLVDQHKSNLTLPCVLLFVGAMAKSAQIGLHTWLPDAMEAPTPVSALIHAATMVTAGVLLTIKMAPLLEHAPLARDIILYVGSATALIAATIACVQNEIKRIIAFSTCSQLGYMFMAVGLAAYDAALFHLTTHAFFKALLFLSAGSVIHAMSDENNIQNMGGIWRYIPLTYALMWVGSLALAGIPFFAGFYSKDLIIDITWKESMVAFGCGITAAFLTAFYAWRILLLTFHGKAKANDAVMGHIHEAPLTMLIPLMILGVASVISGYALSYVFEIKTPWMYGIPVGVSLLGIGLAYVMYMTSKPWAEWLAAWFRPVYIFLLNKWYVDELYDFMVVRPTLGLGKQLWTKGDQAVIEGLGPRGFASLSLTTGRLIASLQTGRLYHYALAMIGGVVVMIGVLLAMGKVLL